MLLSAAMGPLEEEVVQRLRSRGVRVVPDAVVEVLGEGPDLTGVRTAAGQVVEVEALFMVGHPVPHDGFLHALALEREEGQFGSFLAVDPTGRTSHGRVWAVGNVVEPMAAVPMVMSAGAKAGAFVNAVLVEEDFDVAEVAAHWEGWYADTPRKWSGRVNATTADVVATLPVGDALDLGCGEGGDAVWLAEQGWRVTAVDISATATARGAEGAAARGVAERVDWHAHDLATWRTDATFDLVTASFLHSEVDLPRTEILRRAASRLRPGGHLLLVSHVFESEADVPPWASRHAHDHEDGHGPDEHHSPMPVLLLPAEEVAGLDLDPDDLVGGALRGQAARGHRPRRPADGDDEGRRGPAAAPLTRPRSRTDPARTSPRPGPRQRRGGCPTQGHGRAHPVEHRARCCVGKQTGLSAPPAETDARRPRSGRRARAARAPRSRALPGRGRPRPWRGPRHPCAAGRSRRSRAPR